MQLLDHPVSQATSIQHPSTDQSSPLLLHYIDRGWSGHFSLGMVGARALQQYKSQPGRSNPRPRYQCINLHDAFIAWLCLRIAARCSQSKAVKGPGGCICGQFKGMCLYFLLLIAFCLPVWKLLRCDGSAEIHHLSLYIKACVDLK